VRLVLTYTRCSRDVQQLIRRADTTGRADRPQRRPTLASIYGASVLGPPVALFAYAASAASIILIVIAATSFRDLAVGAKVATILHFCIGPLVFVPVGNNYGPFLCVAIAAAYAEAEGSVRNLSRLEISFVVLSIVGNFMTGLVRTAHRFVFDGILYNEWIQTYTLSSADDSEKKFTAKWNRRVNRLMERMASGMFTLPAE
jgi:hypothetical protein